MSARPDGRGVDREAHDVGKSALTNTVGYSYRGTGHYLAGMDIMSLRVCSRVMHSSILKTNFGVWPFTICRMLGPNSWKTLIPASLPMVEPKLLNVADVDCAQ